MTLLYLFYGIQITFQNQAGCHRIHSIFPLLAMIIVLREDIMGFNSGAALIPHSHRQTRYLGDLA